MQSGRSVANGLKKCQTPAPLLVFEPTVPLYCAFYEYSKSRWRLGADVAPDRAPILQSLQARSLPG
jgi:hypothetical protein